MDSKELLECINFFNDLEVIENDVTTEEDIVNFNKVVVADYIFQGRVYKTNKLYYKDIMHQRNIRNPDAIVYYFGSKVYWLDNVIHDWPKGSGEGELEETIIDEMVEGDNIEFKALLKRLANNEKTGYIQRITSEGKSAQYHFNLENNNHWHDLIILIKEMINKKGAAVDKRFFSRLIFKWDGDKHTERERSSLAKEVEWKSRAFIDNLYANIKAIQNTITDMEILTLLNEKKQIILQGPPGTGKTYTAKDIAEQVLFGNISEDKKEQIKRLESTDCYKLIQLHPAYSYEDFVRGIVAESKGESIEYKTKNKVLAEFAKAAQINFINSTKAPTIYSFEKWVEEQFLHFVETVEVIVEENDTLELTKKVSVFDTDADAFRYKGQEGWVKNGNRMLFSDIIKAYIDKNETRQDVKNNIRLSGLAHHHASYYIRVLDLFKEYLKVNEIKYINDQQQYEPLRKFILIVDEINRANLPAVLGELIYALEYRGEKVESIYATEDDGNTLVIPPNLYIIGTMNTSDRSVGHIDYAIRRRFSFIDLLPKVLPGDSFQIDLFKRVSALFIQNVDEYIQDDTVLLKNSEHLSEEFRPEDVWLGHSYFIKSDGDFNFRKKYEIVPILKEYIKDGILKQSASSVINAL